MELIPNWIGIYDNVIDHNWCQTIIDKFESSPEKRSGIIIWKGEETIDTEMKDSTDLCLSFNELLPFIKHIDVSLEAGVDKYLEDHPSIDKVAPWSLYPFFNIQRYYPGQGYHEPHCEDSDGKTQRILAWMIYLNSVTDGGETRFPDYDLNVEAVEGRLVVWPAYFTHIHHGLTSPTQTKYIATGWYTFSQ